MTKDKIEILVGENDLWSCGLSKLNGCTLDNLDDIVTMVREYRPMIDAVNANADRKEINRIRTELSDFLATEYKVYFYGDYCGSPSVYLVTPGEFAIVRDTRDYETLVTMDMMRAGEIYI